jgi:hypothetical protein
MDRCLARQLEPIACLGTAMAQLVRRLQRTFPTRFPHLTYLTHLTYVTYVTYLTHLTPLTALFAALPRGSKSLSICLFSVSFAFVLSSFCRKAPEPPP